MQTDLKKLEKLANWLNDDMPNSAESVKQAIAEIEELRADAGRYRFLRNQTNEPKVFISERHPSTVVIRLTFEYADAAIDKLLNDFRPS